MCFRYNKFIFVNHFFHFLFRPTCFPKSSKSDKPSYTCIVNNWTFRQPTLSAYKAQQRPHPASETQ